MSRPALRTSRTAWNPYPSRTSASVIRSRLRRHGRTPVDVLESRRALLDLHGVAATAGRTSHRCRPSGADGRLHFCTGPAEQKAVNLARNPHVALTTGTQPVEGGTRSRGRGQRRPGQGRRPAADPRRPLAQQVPRRLGLHRRATGRSSTRTADPRYVFEVAPTKVLAFAKGRFAQTPVPISGRHLSCPWQRDLVDRDGVMRWVAEYERAWRSG